MVKFEEVKIHSFVFEPISDTDSFLTQKIKQAFIDHYRMDNTNEIGVDAGHVCFMPVKDVANLTEEYPGLKEHESNLDFSKLYDFNGLFGFFRANGVYMVSFDYASREFESCGRKYTDNRVKAVRLSLYGLPTLSCVQYGKRFNNEVVLVSDSCYAVDKPDTHGKDERVWYYKSCNMDRYYDGPDEQGEIDFAVTEARQTWEFDLQNGLRGFGCSSGYGDGGYNVTVEMMPHFYHVDHNGRSYDALVEHLSFTERLLEVMKSTISSDEFEDFKQGQFKSVPRIGSITVTFIGGDDEDEDCDDDGVDSDD